MIGDENLRVSHNRDDARLFSLGVVWGIMTKPCVVIAHFTPLPERYTEVATAIADVIPDVHKEEGCELYALHEEVSGSLVLIEKWSSRELWMTHQTLAPVARIRAAIEGALAADAVVQEMYNHPAGDARKGELYPSSAPDQA